MPLRRHAQSLEALYGAYNRRDFVHPDPVELVHEYANPDDRETVGLIAALLAYGRVRQILASARWVLERLGPSPARVLWDAAPSKLTARAAGFRHRFQTGIELAALLIAMRAMMRRHGSLGRAFAAAVQPGDRTILPALAAWVGELSRDAGQRCGHLLPDPRRGSACKRLHLYLRWMVRRDAVDVGCWKGIGAERLIVPLDVHMHRLARALGATGRASADARTAEQVTGAFRTICPDDPVKYDFALTRLGIHPDADVDEFLAARGCEAVNDA